MPTNAKLFWEHIQPIMSNLLIRWIDEHQHENIADYAAPLAESAKQFGVTVEQFKKRPFGPVFSVDGKRYAVEMTIKKYSYKQIG